MKMLKVGIIVGSTRPGRKAAAVAEWVHNLLKSRNDAEFEIGRHRGLQTATPR